MSQVSVTGRSNESFLSSIIILIDECICITLPMDLYFFNVEEKNLVNTTIEVCNLNKRRISKYNLNGFFCLA